MIQMQELEVADMRVLRMITGIWHIDQWEIRVRNDIRHEFEQSMIAKEITECWCGLSRKRRQLKHYLDSVECDCQYAKI